MDGRVEASARDLVVEELYVRHQAALRRFLVRILRCEDMAADVAQEAWLRLVRTGSGRTVGQPRAYLFQVAANAARDRIAHERKRDRFVGSAPMPETVPCPKPDAEASVAGRERLGLLADAVAELPPRCREVFLMSRIDAEPFALADSEAVAGLFARRG